MKSTLDCLPCLVRQILDTTRLFSDDAVFQENAVRELVHDLADADWKVSPPVLAQSIHRRLRRQTGTADPYLTLKREHNALALRLLPGLRKELDQSPDPLLCATQLAIAGNIIDLGAKTNVREADLVQAIQSALQEPLRGDTGLFRKVVAEAETILYLADNAGEIIFDRLLIEQLGPQRVILAVRGAPILNDALREDARMAGLEGMVRIIDNGSDVPGTDLPQCSAEFRSLFDSADLILSKGQGNYETLSGTPANIFFLFKVKCPVVAKASGQPLNAHVLLAHSVGVQL
jgi:uncharacterized protein with ATP-grasp and redox domains